MSQDLVNPGFCGPHIDLSLVKFNTVIVKHVEKCSLSIKWDLISIRFPFFVSTLIFVACVEQVLMSFYLKVSTAGLCVRKLILRPEIVRNVFILVKMQLISLSAVALGVNRRRVRSFVYARADSTESVLNPLELSNEAGAICFLAGDKASHSG